MVTLQSLLLAAQYGFYEGQKKAVWGDKDLSLTQKVSKAGVISLKMTKIYVQALRIGAKLK